MLEQGIQLISKIYSQILKTKKLKKSKPSDIYLISTIQIKSWNEPIFDNHINCIFVSIKKVDIFFWFFDRSQYFVMNKELIGLQI